MSDKAKVARVTLPREVAEAIEYFRKKGYSNSRIMNIALTGGVGAEEITLVGFEDKDTLMSALVNGYEIEKSPEDKVREYYDSVLNRLYTEGLDDQERRSVLESEACGILRTLDLLEIKIPGVNADA